MKITLIIAIFSSLIMASSAKPGTMKFKNGDSTTFEGSLHGDEHMHWVEDKNGNIVKYNFTTKNYEYAKIGTDKSGAPALVPSGKKVSNSQNAPALHPANDSHLKFEQVKELIKTKAKIHRNTMRPNPFNN